MQAVIERGATRASIRLVQEAFNTTSLSLYTSLGFDVKEPLALIAGKPTGEAVRDGEVRDTRIGRCSLRRALPRRSRLRPRRRAARRDCAQDRRRA